MELKYYVNAIIYFIKIFVANLYVYFCFTKILNNKKNTVDKGIIIILLSDFILSLAYTYSRFLIDNFISGLVLFVLYSIVLRINSKMKLGYSLIISLISYAICLTTYIISMLSGYIAYALIYRLTESLYDYVNLAIILVIQFALIYGFFKIKRFKNGFNFLKNKLNSDFIDIVIINISTVIVIVYYLISSYTSFRNYDIAENIFITFLFLTIVMIITIQKTFTMHYKQKLMKQTLENYEADIKERDSQIERLKDEKFKISKVMHEFSKRQDALELAIKEKISNSNSLENFKEATNTEMSTELSLLERIKDLNNEYSEKLKAIKTLPKLQLTEISEIDDMFKLMQVECDKNNIEFRLKIVGDMFYLVNHIIPKNKLETLIGDLVKNAIIAINSMDDKSSNIKDGEETNIAKDKEILVILGMRDNKYELCVYDSGIEFKIETLLKLGLEPATTHKDEGGSGIGYLTTFETLTETKASLIIKEEAPSENRHYTKGVIIRFDNKHQYKICSYRIDEIKDANKNGRKIVLENKNK